MNSENMHIPDVSDQELVPLKTFVDNINLQGDGAMGSDVDQVR